MDQTLTELINQIYPHIPHDADVTLHFFEYLEEPTHGRLLEDYWRACERSTQGSVNQRIGRLIKVLHHLPNTGRAMAHSTTLIKSYTLH